MADHIQVYDEPILHLIGLNLLERSLLKLFALAQVVAVVVELHRLIKLKLAALAVVVEQL